MPDPVNTILAALPDEDAPAFNQRLKRINLAQGQMFGETGAPVEQVVFPTSGLISVVAELSSGERIETALISHTGVMGASVAFGGKTHVSTSFVQMAGEGLAMRAADFVEIMRSRPNLQTLFFLNEMYLMAQSQQSVACNARHQIPARLATWLLRARDAVGHGSLALTQEFLAQMLGVQRASVSTVASKLQDAGMIAYRRGRIEIIDEKALSEAACECRDSVRMQYKRLFGSELS